MNNGFRVPLKSVDILFLFLFSVFNVTFCSDADIKGDIEKLLADEDSDRPGSIERLDELVVMHGDDLLPFMILWLNDGDEDHRSLALYGISIIGGPAARENLQKEYNRISDIEERAAIKASLCIALGSTKTEEDINFLIESLEGPGLTDEGETIWQPKEAAALTLGILRVQRAITGLKNCSEYDEGGIDTHACRTAFFGSLASESKHHKKRQLTKRIK